MDFAFELAEDATPSHHVKHMQPKDNNSLDNDDEKNQGGVDTKSSSTDDINSIQNDGSKIGPYGVLSTDPIVQVRFIS